MSRSGAEELLLGANMTNGLFLVRQSERSASDYALSFCYNRKVYHNRIMKGGDGTLYPCLHAGAGYSPHEGPVGRVARTAAGWVDRTAGCTHSVSGFRHPAPPTHPTT